MDGIAAVDQLAPVCAWSFLTTLGAQTRSRSNANAVAAAREERPSFA